jgi:hypothetical protein
MKQLVVATTLQEQRNMVTKLRENLKVMYHTDTSIEIIQSGLNRVEVRHRVGDIINTAAVYQVILIPVVMSLEALKGYPSNTNINITSLLVRLDKMKDEVINAVNQCKKPTMIDRRRQMTFENALGILFTGDKANGKES